MTLSQALGLGVLQGATEFLPVSSSGHLALARACLPQAQSSGLLFEVIVHLGTLGAIALVLRRRLAELLRALPSLGTRRPLAPERALARRWLLLIALASVPTALIGLSLRGAVERMHEQPSRVGVALLATGGILLAAERFGRRERGPGELGVADALSIGVAQGIGVLPGISRSGSTVAAALWRGARPEVAVEFSILLSVPAVLGANLLEITRAGASGVRGEIVPLAVGFVAAFVTGTLSLTALRWVVVRRRLIPFALYCATVGGGALLLG
ncbi:MAG: undecaprenyl-diphosphate phosphatase [Myxococcota bacterium]